MSLPVVADIFSYMRDTSTEVTVSESSHPRYTHRVRYPEGGKRKDRFFKSEDAAEKFARKARKDIAKEGIMATPVNERERRAVDTFREFAGKLPQKSRPTLQDAIDFYIKHSGMRDNSMTCREVAEKLILRLRQEGKGQRHIDDVTNRLTRFNADYGDWLACDVSTDVIDEFLDGMKVSNQTKLNYRNKVNQLFRYAIKLGACDKNPAENAIKPKSIGGEIGILEPERVAALLAVANAAVLPGLAIGFFAGLRESEIQRLDWADIDLEEGHIIIAAKKAKSAQRRIVTISENLKAWLLPHAKRKGLVVGKIGRQWRKGKEDARSAAGITEWPPNAARHSFASYHLAMHEDAGKTALELGHSNQRIIFQHYRQLVKPRDAKTYWSIVPEQADNITTLKAQ